MGAPIDLKTSTMKVVIKLTIDEIILTRVYSWSKNWFYQSEIDYKFNKLKTQLHSYLNKLNTDLVNEVVSELNASLASILRHKQQYLRDMRAGYQFWNADLIKLFWNAILYFIPRYPRCNSDAALVAMFTKLTLHPKLTVLNATGLPYRLQAVLADALSEHSLKDLTSLSFEPQPKLTSLECLFYEGEFGHQMTAELVTRVAKAPMLDCPSFYLNHAVFEHLKCLTSLTLMYCCRNCVLKSVSNHCYKLAHLDISYSYKVGDSGGNHILKCRNIKKLRVKDTKISHWKVAHIIYNLPQLSDIDSCNEAVLNDLIEMQALSRQFKCNFQPAMNNILRFGIFCNGNTQPLVPFSALFQHIQKVDLSVKWNPNYADSLAPLALLFHLQALTIRGAPFFEPGSLISILELLGDRLKFLHIEMLWRESMNISVVTHIVNYCSNLEELSIEEGIVEFPNSDPFVVLGLLQASKAPVQLEKLSKLRLVSHRSSSAMGLLFLSAPNIVELRIEASKTYPLKLRSQFFCGLFSNSDLWCNSLRCLHINGSQLNISTARYFAERFSRLEKLGFLRSWEMVYRYEIPGFAAEYKNISVDSLSDVDGDVSGI